MAGDKTIYMRDITGFWVLDECIKVWKNQGIDTRPGNLAGIARAAKENSSYIDVDALVFSSYSVDMPAEIQHYCKVTGQPVPGSVGEIIRCVLESCALRVRYCYKALCDIAGKKDFAKVYAVSGGIHNEILCQSLSDALQKQLIAGNPMASSAGNLLTQFLSAGIIKSLDEARRIATNTFPTRTYNPDAGKKQKWDDALFYMASHGYFDCVGSTKIERLYQYQTNKEK
jgi:rhamnulokinase